MKNITADNITDAVLARFDTCDNPRLKEVMSALVRRTHDFIRDVKLTEAEWMEGIQFLTQTGLKCTGQRQEFILLSDTLGVSMLVTAMNNEYPAGATEATVFGPFHTEEMPLADTGADIGGDAPGEPLFVNAQINGLGGEPVVNAEVDIWQADDDGLYDVQRPELGDTRRARARMHTDADGNLKFRTVVPTPYPVPTDGPVGAMLVATGRHPWRPAHLHFRIRASGYSTLITHIFREPDPYLDSDAVFGVRSSLIGEFVEHAAGKAPDGATLDQRFFTLDQKVVLAPT